jgi:hypothetical protein
MKKTRRMKIMKESKSKTYLYRTKDTMFDIFEKLKNNKNNLDVLTDDEIGKLFTFGTAIQVMADEEYEKRTCDENQYNRPDIYDLSLKNTYEVLHDYFIE